MEILTANVERKAFGDTIVIADKSLHLSESQAIAILGHSGIGKTTFLRILARLDTQVDGNVVGCDEELIGKPRQIQYLHQDPVLFKWLTVRENIAAFSESGSYSDPDSIIPKLRLLPLLDRYPTGLSGGQKQAVAIARALASKPKVLILDEAFHSCDAELKIAMRSVLLGLKENQGLSIVYVTHAPDEAIMLCDQIQVIQNDFISDESTVCIDAPRRQNKNRSDSSFRESVAKCYELLDFSA